MGRRIKEDAILITGIGGRLGRLLVRRLHRHEKLIGIDTVPFEDAPKDVITYKVDLRRRQAEDIFRRHRIKAVIHLGILHSRRQRSAIRHSINVVGTQMLLSYCERYNIPKAVILSSANVYGPRPGNPQFLKEDTPLLGSESYYALRDLVSVDMVSQSFFWKHPEVETVILRPVHIVGRLDNSPSNYLRQSIIPTVMGFDPMMQLIHEEDVVQGIHRALIPGLRGVFNLSGPGTAPLRQVLKVAGKTALPVPLPIMNAGLRLAWRMRLSSYTPPEIQRLRYICTVDDSLARDVLRFDPKYSLEETLEYLSELRLASPGSENVIPEVRRRRRKSPESDA